MAERLNSAIVPPILAPRMVARGKVRRGTGWVGIGMLKMAARPGELNPAAGDRWVALPFCLRLQFWSQ